MNRNVYKNLFTTNQGNRSIASVLPMDGDCPRIRGNSFYKYYLDY